jgi:uncharacterized protein (UPF0276 family)
MMEFAINFSEPAAELLRTGQIKLDRFKVPDWPDLIQRARQSVAVYVHFAINAGAADSKTRDWAVAETMARQTNTPFINLHLAPRAKDFPGIGHDPAARPVIDAMLSDVKRAVDFFGRDRVIAENIPLGNPEEDFAPASVQPAAIHEIIEKTGAGLLLDLSHARLTATHLGVDPREYISSLPVKKLRELHLTGIQRIAGRLRDHMHFSDIDWEFAQWAMERIKQKEWATPAIVALEYGGVGETFAWRTDRAQIAEQVPRLYEMVHRTGDQRR